MRGAKIKQPGLRPHAVQYAAGSITWRPGGTWPRLHARKSVDIGWGSVVSPTHARRCGVASHRFRSHEKAALGPAVRYHWWAPRWRMFFFFFPQERWSEASDSELRLRLGSDWLPLDMETAVACFQDASLLYERGS